jgi:hypothetical protein
MKEGYLESNFATNNSGCALDFVQILRKVRWRPWQLLEKRSGKTAGAMHGKSKHTEIEKDKTGEEQSQEHAHRFL